jgi:Fic family protein
MSHPNHYQNQCQACSKLLKELAAYRPLDNHTLTQLRQYYRVGLTYTSNAIEGNTLTESETKVLLEDGLTVGGKPMKDHLAALGHAKAYDLLYELVEKSAVSEQDILELHRLVAEGQEAEEPGRYRNKAVMITGTLYLPPAPQAVPKAMQTLIEQQLPEWRKTEHPVHVAALAHLHLVTIHPFLDGNGRTARLLMNLVLMKAGYGTTIVPPVLRADYMACLRAFQEKQNSEPFLNFISSMVYEALKEGLRLLRHLKPNS